MIKLDDTPKQEETETELKPCPFCGDKASTMVEIVTDVRVQMYLSVRCAKCSICRGAYVNRSCSFDDILSAMKIASERWNRRADNDEAVVHGY